MRGKRVVDAINIVRSWIGRFRPDNNSEVKDKGVKWRATQKRKILSALW